MRRPGRWRRRCLRAGASAEEEEAAHGEQDRGGGGRRDPLREVRRWGARVGIRTGDLPAHRGCRHRGSGRGGSAGRRFGSGRRGRRRRRPVDRQGGGRGRRTRNGRGRGRRSSRGRRGRRFADSGPGGRHVVDGEVDVAFVRRRRRGRHGPASQGRHGPAPQGRPRRPVSPRRDAARREGLGSRRHLGVRHRPQRSDLVGRRASALWRRRASLDAGRARGRRGSNRRGRRRNGDAMSADSARDRTGRSVGDGVAALALAADHPHVPHPRGRNRSSARSHPQIGITSSHTHPHRARISGGPAAPQREPPASRRARTFFSCGRSSHQSRPTWLSGSPEAVR